MYYVYILYSNSQNSYYIGQTLDIEQRINEHNSGKYSGSFTKIATDWKLFFKITCKSRTQAIKIETHIKKMKSRKYLENLKLYPGISEKLLSKYS